MVVKLDRHFFWKYPPELYDIWERQSARFRQLCIELGIKKGQSGFTTFFIWLVVYLMVEEADWEFEDYTGEDCFHIPK